MGIKNVKSVSSAGEKTNEDVYGINKNSAWVLDGSSGLTQTKVTNSDSDAKWLVEQWDEFLKENINRDLSLSEIIREGILKIRYNFKKMLGEREINYIEYPSAAIAIVRFKDLNAEYFVLGDCSILLEDCNGKVKQIFDDRVSKLDNLVIDKMKNISERENIHVFEAKSLCDEDLLKNRSLKNSDEGYYILGFEEVAIEHALTGSIEIKDKLNIGIISDGFSQYYDTLGLAENKEIFFSKIKKNDVVELLSEIRVAQENDKFCDKYPRMKKSDDATLLYFEVELI